MRLARFAPSLSRQPTKVREEILLWDQDGVIVDTEPWFYEATRLTLAEHDIPLTRPHWHACQAKGLGLGQVVRQSSISLLDFGEIRAHRDDVYASFLESEDVLVDGVDEVLSYLGEHFRMALVTNSLRRFVEQLHAGGTLLDHFEHVVTGSECTKAKPHPELYLRALELLDAPPSAAIAVEDSPRGLRAAQAAGVSCLIVRSEFMRDADFEGARGVVDSIRDLPSALGV